MKKEFGPFIECEVVILHKPKHIKGPHIMEQTLNKEKMPNSHFYWYYERGIMGVYARDKRGQGPVWENFFPFSDVDNISWLSKEPEKKK